MSDVCDFDFNDPHWRRFAPSKLKELGISPNDLRHNAETNTGALVVRRSTNYAEFAMSKAGLEYLQNAVQQGDKIRAGIVVLIENDGPTVVATKPIGEVVAALKGIEPRKGPHGPYWWLTANLTPYDDTSTPF